MDGRLPSIIVTGASGFLGRHFLEAAKDEYLIYAVCRRPQKEAGVAAHPHIKWIQVDIGNLPALEAVMHRVKDMGGADYVLHLAGYYDFSYGDHPEYLRTNVDGTRHMLEQARWLCVKRFLFASSLAACPFPSPGGAVTEQSPLEADFPYAWSKRRGEEMLREYSEWFPCTALRCAAVFSDWCEYAPLYVLLSTWLSRRWNARILGGRGESALTYIHVNDLNRLILTILAKSCSLPAFDVYCASPSGSTSHRELFEMATRCHFGEAVHPLLLPRTIAYPGVLGRDVWGRLVGRRPFERPWMIGYLDRRLNVDSSYTQRAVGWEPIPRYHVLRRLVFLIEKMKSRPEEWRTRNEAAMKRGADRPNLRISEAMLLAREPVIERIVAYIRAPERNAEFAHYRAMSPRELEWYVGVVYRLLMAGVRTGDRTLLLQYADDLAHRLFAGGFAPAQISGGLLAMARFVVADLLARPELRDLEQQIRDSLTLTVQLAADEIEDYYDWFVRQTHPVPGLLVEGIAPSARSEDIERPIAQLEAFYEPPPERRGPPGSGDQHK